MYIRQKQKGESERTSAIHSPDSPKPYDLPVSSTTTSTLPAPSAWPIPSHSLPPSPTRARELAGLDSGATASLDHPTHNQPRMDSSRSSLLDEDYDNYPPHTRLPNEQVLELYAELTLQGEYHLLPYEEAWKSRRPFLESKGYELRPRYSEDWWPSWIGTDINPFFCEDSIDSCVRIVHFRFRFHFHFHFQFLFPL